MNIVVPTCTYKNGSDACFVIEKLYGYGFRNIDVSFDYFLKPFQDRTQAEWARKLKDKGDALGISFYQAHGIGALSDLSSNPDYWCCGAIDAAEILGVKWLVMHPDNIPDKTAPECDEYYAEENARRLRPFFKRCEEKGIGVAIENLPWPNSSRLRCVKWIADIIDSPLCGVCFDTGHADANHTKPEEIEIFGDKLVTVHIQDTYGKGGDDHLIPFHGQYDWEGFIRTLRKIDYRGELVLEAHHQTIDAETEEERDGLFKSMMDSALKLLDMWNNN